MGQHKLANIDSSKLFVDLEDLSASTKYQFTLVECLMNGDAVQKRIDFVTEDEPIVIDVTQPPYRVPMYSEEPMTEQIQQAIDDCPKGGIVRIPEDAFVITGGLTLKSDMTLEVNGTLKGSDDPRQYTVSDHYPIDQQNFVMSRYEGIELLCFKSLINVGYLNPDDRKSVTCHNVKITGSGAIIGGGQELGDQMEQPFADSTKYPEYLSDGIPGRRVRGRLISVIQTKDFSISGVTLKQPSSWTVHVLYSNNVTIHKIRIDSRGVDNGDGIDPDSSQNIYIFDVNFQTSDDCIAIKSGKNPEGNIINIPTTNVNIFNLQMTCGHGFAIGSEQSGGVNRIYISECVIADTDNGIELKASNARGGYISNVYIDHCQIDSLFMHSVNYNSDGKRSDQLPVFKNIFVSDCEILGNTHDVDNLGNTLTSKGKSVEIIGFKDQQRISNIQNIYFKNVLLQVPTNLFYLEMCDRVILENVHGKNNECQLKIGAHVKHLEINNERISNNE